MAFEGISGGLQNIFKKLTGRGRLSEKDVKDAMREIRLVLLEADVNFLVVKDFVKKVTERAVGVDVLESLTPGQQIIKIVNEEMTALMGSTNARLDFGSTKPAIFLMAGLVEPKSSLALVAPMRAVISSLTILMICWPGVRLSRTSAPTARSVTFFTKSFTTR
jgi:hypothetical protein